MPLPLVEATSIPFPLEALRVKLTSKLAGPAVNVPNASDGEKMPSR